MTAGFENESDNSESSFDENISPVSKVIKKYEFQIAGGRKS